MEKPQHRKTKPSSWHKEWLRVRDCIQEVRYFLMNWPKDEDWEYLKNTNDYTITDFLRYLDKKIWKDQEI